MWTTLAGAFGRLMGPGEVLTDVGRCPGLFAFVGADPDPQLSVRHLGFGAVGPADRAQAVEERHLRALPVKPDPARCAFDVGHGRPFR